MLRRFASLGVLLLVAATGAQAHALREHVEAGAATVVTLTFADDEPYSFERYELLPQGSDKPHQTGLTDRKGRVVFMPDGISKWRLRSTSADGHGVDIEFEVPPR
nr:hypothetical protein [Variovorax boronicumulans]